MQIYVHRDNKQLGPFTEAELQALINTGAVTMQDSVWWQDQANWLPLSQTSLAATIKPPVPGIPAVAVGSSVTAGKTSNLALWSMICGISSFFCGLTFIPAIIMGHMGLSETKKNPAIQGRGMAIAGLVMGYLYAALFIVIVAISVLIALGNQVKGTFKTIDAKVQDSSDTTDTSTNSAPATDSTTNTPPAVTP